MYKLCKVAQEDLKTTQFVSVILENLQLQKLTMAPIYQSHILYVICQKKKGGERCSKRDFQGLFSCRSVGPPQQLSVMMTNSST